MRSNYNQGRHPNCATSSLEAGSSGTVLASGLGLWW
jgi:hypothetical protein